MNKEEYAKYLQTEHWSKVRHDALEYAERRCQLCYSLKDVEVHHRTYDRIGDERPADLTVLCKMCHEKHHDRHEQHRRVAVTRLTPEERARMPGLRAS